MNADHIEIFQDANYLVFSHGPMVHPCTIIGMSSRGADYHPLMPRDFRRGFFPDHVTQWGVVANFVSFVPSRNCWYLAPEVQDAVAAINAVTAQGRVVTYGSSMGGYAAINLSSGLNADYFFALSPLSTIFDPFMSEIRDSRFKDEREMLPSALDGIARGDHAGRRGLIVFDDRHDLDARHAEVILSNTAANALRISHCGHPSTESLNRICALKSILAGIADQTLDPVALQQRIDRIVPDLPATLAASLETFGRFLDMLDQSPDDMTHEGFRSAGKTLADHANRTAITHALLDRVGQAVVGAKCWGNAHTAYIETLWRICVAFENIGARDSAKAYASANLPERERALFLARK